MANGSYKKVITLGLDYSEFQGGMKDCADEMKKLDAEHKAMSSEMEKTASNAEKLAEANDHLAKKIELQSRRVDLAKQKLDDLKSSESATEAQIRKAATAVANETAELNKLNNELIDTNINQTNLRQNAAMLAAVITAIGAAAASCVKDVMEYADSITTLSEQTGVSVETLQAWDYASERIDTDFNTMTNAFKKLESNMANSPEAFQRLGVSVQDSSGHMRKAEDVYMETIDALRQIGNATEQDQAAMEIFGKSATELTGMINAGSQGLKDYANEAQALGIILSSEDVAAANKAKDAWDKLTSSLDAAKMKIGAELAPIVTALANAISSVPAPVLATVAAVTSMAVAVAALVVTISSVVRAFSNIASVIGGANLVMNPHLLLILAIVAALALLAYSIKEIIELYKEWKQVQEQVNKQAEHMSSSLQLHSGSGYSRGADHKATGGVSRGGMTWVGENGPELVDLPAGAKVYNSRDSRQMTNNATYNISMNVDITKLKSVRDVVDAVQGLGMSASV